MIAPTNDMSQNQEGESPYLRKENQDEGMRHARKGEKLLGAINLGPPWEDLHPRICGTAPFSPIKMV